MPQREPGGSPGEEEEGRQVQPGRLAAPLTPRSRLWVSLGLQISAHSLTAPLALTVVLA